MSPLRKKQQLVSLPYSQTSLKVVELVIFNGDCRIIHTLLSHQGKDGQEHSVFERGAHRRAVEEQVGEREGEEQDAEKHCHLARDRTQPVEEW